MYELSLKVDGGHAVAGHQGNDFVAARPPFPNVLSCVPASEPWGGVLRNILGEMFRLIYWVLLVLVFVPAILMVIGLAGITIDDTLGTLPQHMCMPTTESGCEPPASH